MKIRLILTIAILFLSVLSASVLMAQGNKALSLDRSGDYVQVEDNSILRIVKQISLEAWLNFNNIEPHNSIIQKAQGTSWHNSDYWLFTDSSSISVLNGGIIDFRPYYPLENGRYYHVCATYDGSEVKIYVDGVLTGSQNVKGDIHVSNGNLIIGKTTGGEYPYNGQIDEVRIWNIARTQEQIQATMNTRLRGNEPGLVGYWNFDDGTANDLSPSGNHGSLKGDAKIVESDLAIGPIVIPQSIIPQTVHVPFSLGIDAVYLANLHNFTFDLAFNPDILQAVSVEAGSFLNNNGKDPITYEITKGRITDISCRRENADGVSGSGVLTQITFEAIGVGESALQIENASFSAPDGSPIEFWVRDGAVTVFAPHGRVTGRVIDFQGVPVGGIEVFALKDGVSIGISGETDWDGNYIIENITEAGQVTVRARKAGLLPGIAMVSVQIGVTTDNVDFVLGEPSGLNSVVDANGFIRNWLLLGPIPWENDANRLMTDYSAVTNSEKSIQPQEPETKPLQPRAGEYGKGFAETLRWKLHKDSDGDVDLGSLYGNSKYVVYAFTLVKSLEEREVTLQLGSGDGVMVWFNDELVHLKGTTRSREVDQDAVENLTLNAGWNRLLIKVENQGDGWGFFARFAEGEELTPITNLDISPQWAIGQDCGDSKEFNAQISLTSGVNMISLPLNPDVAYTASILAQELAATIIIRSHEGAFQVYVPEGEFGIDFPIEMGKGYIVNVLKETQFNLTGRAWGTAVPTAPSIPNTWAFVIAGMLPDEVPKGTSILVTNGRTGQSAIANIDQSGEFTAAFVDMNKKSVVKAGDEILIRIIGASGTQLTEGKKHIISDEQIAHAYLLTHPLTKIDHTRLLQNFPNPFNPETWIPYQLAEDAVVRIAIYDINGALVRQLNLGHQQMGYYQGRSNATCWNGCNNSGEKVASGIYFYHLSAGDFTATRRMTVMK